jgi:hypothetical protein
LTPAFQQMHPRCEKRTFPASGAFFLGLEIRLYFPIENTAEAVKSIDASHGFNHTRIGPDTLIVRQTENSEFPDVFPVFLSHGFLLSLGALG